MATCSMSGFLRVCRHHHHYNRVINASHRLLHNSRNLACSPAASTNGHQVGNTNVCVRFAPSPTGLLHLGGARTALYNYMMAQRYNGTLLLRIEDTDRKRLQPGSVDALQRDLRWLGMDRWQGPTMQSDRLSIYRDHAQVLVDHGRAYRCFCTTDRLNIIRREALARREIPKYDNRCRLLEPADVKDRVNNKTPHVLRFRLQSTPNEVTDHVFGCVHHDISNLEGDPVIMKSDGFPTYHFANVVDDHLMRITHVIRGEEWMASVVKHAQIYDAFGWTMPHMVHLPLMVEPGGKKLSKRHGDISIARYRNDGYLPIAIVNFLTRNGMALEDRVELTLYSLEELTAKFRLDEMKRLNTIVDFDWLRYYGEQSIWAMDDESRVNHVQQSLSKKWPENPTVTDGAKIQRVLEFCRTTHRSVERFGDFVQGELASLWAAPDDTEELANELLDIVEAQKLVKLIDELHQVFTRFQPLPHATQPFEIGNTDEFSAELRKVAKQQKFPFGKLMKVLRICVTGQTSGMPLAQMVGFLGTEEVRQRLSLVKHHVCR